MKTFFFFIRPLLSFCCRPVFVLKVGDTKFIFRRWKKKQGNSHSTMWSVVFWGEPVTGAGKVIRGQQEELLSEGKPRPQRQRWGTTKWEALGAEHARPHPALLMGPLLMQRETESLLLWNPSPRAKDVSHFGRPWVTYPLSNGFQAEHICNLN